MSSVPTEVKGDHKTASILGLPILDFSHRAELTERMDEPCSREQLRACLRDIARLNRWFLGHRATLSWLKSIAAPALAKPGRGTRPLRILDVGCGYGDLLRRIVRWAAASGVPVEATGMDINPDAVAIASEDGKAKGIGWVCADIFAYEPPEPVDLVVSSLFAHHLRDAEVVRFIGWMEKRARIGWFINDLSRNSVPYFLLAAFAKVARLHPFVRHDGPVSIARAFRPEDWERTCAAAGLKRAQFDIHEHTPARLCVARRK